LAKALVGKQFGKKYAEGTDEDFANYTPETK
jgi:isoleucyl-tRNA synthetase